MRHKCYVAGAGKGEKSKSACSAASSKGDCEGLALFLPYVAGSSSTSVVLLGFYLSNIKNIKSGLAAGPLGGLKWIGRIFTFYLKGDFSQVFKSNKCFLLFRPGVGNL